MSAAIYTLFNEMDLAKRGYEDGWHVYTCGANRYMDRVMEAAERAGFPEEARHLENFSVPKLPEYINHEFVLKLSRAGKQLRVPADKSAADVLNESGIAVDVKCSDGIRGVCKCNLNADEVEHRNFVFSKSQRETSMILCQSRALKDQGVVEIDL